MELESPLLFRGGETKKWPKQYKNKNVILIATTVMLKNNLFVYKFIKKWGKNN
jgi:hypothetical protein